MKIRFVAEWMGNKPGTVRDIRDGKAKELIERGTAKLEEDRPRRILNKRPKAKKPEKDKMVRGAKDK